ncbi:MAG: alcohol dehydrogenase catalytic domain-containing protein [Actinomycetota bacterium]|nr:alcohol dehydrogenase catalytic domain-containing protein [Actinomycetota bacterium]
MRAVRCADHRVSCIDVPEPRGDGVTIRIAAAGICGSDLHSMEVMPTPATLGHEFAGYLLDGRLVAIEPIAACGTCGPCRDGRPYHCRTGLQMLGGTHDGGMADMCIVPESTIVALPEAVQAKDSSLVEPLAVAVHAVRLAGNLRGLATAVIGGGTIGLCLVPSLQAVGVGAIDVLARHGHQIEAVARLGGRLGEFGRNKWDVVFDAVGTGESLAQAVKMCRPGGRIVLVGMYWDGTVPMPGMELMAKELLVIPSMMYGSAGTVRDFDLAAKLLADRSEIGPTLITHRFPLDAAAEAFAAARDRKSGAIKVVLEP